jgi:hypothetical protein
MTSVAVPEAAVHENGDLMSGEDDVRLSRQRTGVKLVAKSGAVHTTPDVHFRLRIFAPYRRHISAAAR